MMAEVTRLAEVAAAYGADPARWPPEERAALEVLAARHPDALFEAGNIDRVLGGASAPVTPGNGAPRLVRRIAPVPGDARVVASRPRRRQAGSWAIAACLAASLACGVYIGTLSETDLLFDPGSASSGDPVDLAGLGDVTDLLGDT